VADSVAKIVINLATLSRRLVVFHLFPHIAIICVRRSFPRDDSILAAQQEANGRARVPAWRKLGSFSGNKRHSFANQIDSEGIFNQFGNEPSGEPRDM
jgi:hypothetical protein